MITNCYDCDKELTKIESDFWNIIKGAERGYCHDCLTRRILISQLA